MTENKNNDSLLCSTIITIVFILASWVGSYFYFFNINNWDTASDIGGSFGAINSLFSGLALAGVVLAILLQKKELKLQREEIKFAREAQEKSAKELAEQTLLQYVTLKYDALNKILSSLPDRIEKRRLEIITRVGEESRYNPDFIKKIDQFSSVLDNQKIELEMKKATSEDAELNALKNKLLDLTKQRDELDEFMSKENPELIRRINA